MLRKTQNFILVNLSQISPPMSQPVAAIYESYLDVYFNKNSEERLKTAIAHHLATHLPHVFIRKTCNQQYELVAGYRLYHLAENLGLKSIPALIVEDMTAEDLFELAITNSVLPLLAFDTKETKATNKQLREFYSSLLNNLDAGFSDLLKSPYLAELLDIPRSHLRRSTPAKKTDLELQRQHADVALTSLLDSQNIMSKLSFRDPDAAVEVAAAENKDVMKKIWARHLSEEQEGLLKDFLRETSQHSGFSE